MKTKDTFKRTGLRSFAFVGILALAIFAVSCNDDAFHSTEYAEAELKKGEKSNAPGDDPIAAIAIGAGFDSLVVALSYVDAELDAGLVDLFLNGTDQYTVFAPTNGAFEQLVMDLGIGKLADLPASVVLDVLLYHVTDGRRAARSVVPNNGYKTIESLSGETFKVGTDLSIMDTGERGASIIAADINASNGIIHVIDQVILPF